MTTIEPVTDVADVGDGADSADAVVVPMAELAQRQRVTVRGRVRSIRVRPWADTPTLEVVLVDETGGIDLVFLSRRRIAGIRLGSVMVATGMVGVHQRRLAILNPEYQLESVPALHH